MAIVAACIGGGLTLFGQQIPVINSVPRQVALAISGLVLIGLSYSLMRSSTQGTSNGSRQPAPVQTVGSNPAEVGRLQLSLEGRQQVEAFPLNWSSISQASVSQARASSTSNISSLLQQISEHQLKLNEYLVDYMDSHDVEVLCGNIERQLDKGRQMPDNLKDYGYWTFIRLELDRIKVSRTRVQIQSHLQAFAKAVETAIQDEQQRNEEYLKEHMISPFNGMKTHVLTIQSDLKTNCLAELGKLGGQVSAILGYTGQFVQGAASATGSEPRPRTSGGIATQPRDIVGATQASSGGAQSVQGRKTV